MQIVISHQSMTPLYEQIVESIKKQILTRALQENDPLPSVRGLAATLKISALTVKKAYDVLEDQGYIVTIHGKGSAIAPVNRSNLEEDRRRRLEQCLADAISQGREMGMSDDEIKTAFSLLMEETL